MSREPRFPGITWYCEKCGDCISTQKGFDDHKYTWKCRDCGFKNSISWDNVSSGDSAATKVFLLFLGFLSFVGFWSAVMLGISLFVLRADHNVYFIPFLIFLTIYLIAFAVTIILQFTLRHKTKSAKKIIFEILYDFSEDLRMPFVALKEIICTVLAMITRILPTWRKFKWYTSPYIVILAVLYIAIFVIEILLFNTINNVTFADWWNWIQNAFMSLVRLITGLFQR